MLYHKAIASTQARFRFLDGTERLVTIEIGAPFESEKEDWRCELDIRGLEGAVTAMIGSDSLSALSAALYFLRLTIQRYRDQGVRVLFPNAEEDFILDVFFPPGIPPESEAPNRVAGSD